MGILDWIGGLFTPAQKIIDKFVTSDKEKMELTNALAQIQADVQVKMLEYDNKVLELQGKVQEAQARIIESESKSESAFTRLYKPIIISGMFVIIALNYLGLLKNPIPDLFIQIFGTAFGVVTLAPSLTAKTKELLGKFGGKDGA